MHLPNAVSVRHVLQKKGQNLVKRILLFPLTTNGLQCERERHCAQTSYISKQLVWVGLTIIHNRRDLLQHIFKVWTQFFSCKLLMGVSGNASTQQREPHPWWESASNWWLLYVICSKSYHSIPQDLLFFHIAAKYNEHGVSSFMFKTVKNVLVYGVFPYTVANKIKSIRIVTLTASIQLKSVSRGIFHSLCQHALLDCFSIVFESRMD